MTNCHYLCHGDILWCGCENLWVLNWLNWVYWLSWVHHYGRTGCLSPGWFGGRDVECWPCHPVLSWPLPLNAPSLLFIFLNLRLRLMHVRQWLLINQIIFRSCLSPYDISFFKGWPFQFSNYFRIPQSYQLIARLVVSIEASSRFQWNSFPCSGTDRKIWGIFDICLVIKKRVYSGMSIQLKLLDIFYVDLPKIRHPWYGGSSVKKRGFSDCFW